jgi:hypothetical protein
MWNDMPNQKVGFESYSHIAPKYVSSTILDFKWNLTIFLHNKLWVYQLEPRGYILMWIIVGSVSYILVAKHLHRKDINTKKKILVPRLKLTYFGLCAGVSSFAVTYQLWVILSNSEQFGAISWRSPSQA